jgi:SAM-dependent methyltransferase
MASTPMLTVIDEDKHWWFATRTRAILAFLDRYFPQGYKGRVLDVGCGAGNMAHHLRHYGTVVGVDNNVRPLAIASSRGLEAREGTADALPFGDAEFDLVAMLDTVEHVPAEAQAFEECRRVLKPGGRLLITGPAFMFLWSRNDDINLHQRRYSAGELKGKLQQHGFKVLRISYNNFFIFPLAAALIVLRRGRKEPELASPHFDGDAYQVEMEPASPAVNTLLSLVGRLETALLRRMNLPFGTSVIAIAEKQ